MKGVLLDGLELPRRSCLHDLLEAEQRWPDRPLLRPVGAPDWSVREFASRARACASELERRGVQPGDRVAIMSRNNPLMAAWFYGTYMLGAVEAQINAELRGAFLQHVVSDIDPALIIAQAGVRSALDALADVPAPIIDLEADCPPAGGEAFEVRLPRRDDLASLIYTSGTTGPSKGVMLPHAYHSNYGAILRRVFGFGAEEVLFNLMPWFHIDAHTMFAGCLQTGALLAFPERFSASRCWEQLASTGATIVFSVASMLDAIAAHGCPPEGCEVRVHRIVGGPISTLAYEFFEDRLGMQLLECYGQTEAAEPIYSTPEKRRRGAVGWPCAGSDVAVVDEEGCELPAGVAGEIVYRPNYPGLLTLGYWRRPEATLEAMRNLWWHSGDGGHFDEDGFLYFDGRLTDSLRYRGENVSAWELESVVRQAPGVSDVAAVALRDPLGGEDLIKLFIVLSDAVELDPEGLFQFCAENLPRFAVPRYIEPIAEDAVFRSPGTGVIQKHRLPSENGPLAVDREELSGAADPVRNG